MSGHLVVRHARAHSQPIQRAQALGQDQRARDPALDVTPFRQGVCLSEGIRSDEP